MDDVPCIAVRRSWSQCALRLEDPSDVDKSDCEMLDRRTGVSKELLRVMQACFGLFFVVAPLGAPQAMAQGPSSHVKVFASGLNNTRGLKFGPDGNLYVAEGGAGGTTSTAGQCDQVPAPVGPYAGGFTSRISKIDANGNRTTVIDNLPSSQTSPSLGNLVSGVADTAFLAHTL